MENQEQNAKNLLKSQGHTYTQKSKKLEDAKSSSWLFILFGFAGLALLGGIWLGLIPIPLAFYMRILYTIVLGGLFLILIIVGFHYLSKTKILESETQKEEQQTTEIISSITKAYSLEMLDEQIQAPSLSMEQLYFERYEKIAAIIQKDFGIDDEAYLDYLVEKIYQVYVPEES